MRLVTRACYSSFLLVYFLDVENANYMRIQPAPSEASEVKWAALRLQMKNTGLPELGGGSLPPTQ